MRQSWLTAASVLAAATVEGHQAQAQLFTTSPTTPGTAYYFAHNAWNGCIWRRPDRDDIEPQSLSVTNSAQLGSGFNRRGHGGRSAAGG